MAGTMENTWCPEPCKDCEHAGYSAVWDDGLMFLCTWREWSPKHWLKLQEGGTCPRKEKDIKKARAEQKKRDKIKT